MSGRVLVSVNGVDVAVPNARVDVNGETRFTDERGLWQLPEVPQGKRIVVYVSHFGFAPLVRAYDGHRVAGAFLSHRLLPVAATKRIVVNEGGSIVVPGPGGTQNEVALQLPAGFAQFATDSVDVSVSMVRPQVAHEFAAFPGDFLGEVSNDPRGTDQIQTFGTVEVSFSSGGKPLGPIMLAKPADLSLRLDPVVSADYPEGSSIPTWTLDQATGIWTGEGSARVVVQNGAKYASWSADHFTWWNVDQPISSHACVALKLVPDNDDSRALLEELSFTVAGDDYSGLSQSDDFKDDGMAVVNGWRGHRVRPVFGTLSGQVEPALTALVAKAVFGADGTFMMPATEASALYRRGPGGVPLVPVDHCLYVERPFSVPMGRIRGRVLDEFEDNLAGAVVAVAELGRTVVSDADGQFAFEWVPWSEGGSMQLTVMAMPPANRGGLVFAPATVVRDKAVASVLIVAEPAPRPPVFTGASALNSAPPAGGSTGFEAVIEDDDASLKWAIELCGRYYSGVAASGEADAHKTVLCHRPPGKGENEQSVSVGPEAVDAHLAHGDTVGVCPGVDVSTPPRRADSTGDVIADPRDVACEGATLTDLAATAEETARGRKRYVVRGRWNGGRARGVQTMTLLAKDPLGYVTERGLSVYFRNNSPVVVVDIPDYPRVGETVVAEARASDPDGDPITLRWEINGDLLPDTGMQVVLTGLAEGPNHLRLTVTDGEATVIQLITLYVLPPPAGTDLSPPDTQLLGVPPLAMQATTATFSFASADTDVVGFECRLDTGPFESCDSPHSVHSVPRGVHTLSVRAVDGSGNSDSTPAYATWEVVLLDDRLVYVANLDAPPYAADDAGRRALLESIVSEQFLQLQGGANHRRYGNFIDLQFKHRFDANPSTPIDFNPYDYLYRPITSPVGPYSGELSTIGQAGYEAAAVLSDLCTAIPLVGDACFRLYFVDIDGQPDERLIEYSPQYGTFGIRVHEVTTATYRVDITVPVTVDTFMEPPTDPSLYDIPATSPGYLPERDLSTYVKALLRLEMNPLRFSYRVTLPTESSASQTTLSFFPVHLGYEVDVVLDEFGEVVGMSDSRGSFSYSPREVGPFCNNNLRTTEASQTEPLSRPFGFDGLANYPGLISDPATFYYALFVEPYPHVAPSENGGSGVGRDRMGVGAPHPFAYGTSDNPNNCARPADACTSSDPRQDGGPDAGASCELTNVSNNTDDATYRISNQIQSIIPYLDGEVRLGLEAWGFTEWDY